MGIGFGKNVDFTALGPPFTERVDAVAPIVNTEWYVFSGSQVARIDRLTGRVTETPTPISEKFPKLPAPFSSKIDAVCTKVNLAVYLFSGGEVLLFDIKTANICEAPSAIGNHHVFSKLPPPFNQGPDCFADSVNMATYVFCGDQVLLFDKAAARVMDGPSLICEHKRFSKLPAPFSSKVDAAGPCVNTRAFVFNGDQSMIVDWAAGSVVTAPSSLSSA